MQSHTNPIEQSVTGSYIERDWAVPIHDGLDSHRAAIILAHRRAGKTVMMVAQMIREYFACKLKNPQVAYIAPTAKQARGVCWHYFQDMLKGISGVKFREQMLEIEMPMGGRIILASGEKYDRLRGYALDAAVVDEAADCPSALITEVLLPALLDRKGKLFMIGTVKGRGPFWRQYEKALANPDWFHANLKPDDTRILDEDELAKIRLEIGEETYRQEFLNDPGAAVKGAYYGVALREAEESGRVCKVPYDAGLGVTVSFDLGIADSTSIWFTQIHRGGEIRIIDYREYTNTGFLQILKEVGPLFPITRWIGPHDLMVREYTSGQSRYQSALEVGVQFEVAPKLPVIDGIEAVRRALPRCVFDAEKTREGRDALALYRSEYDETRRVLSRNPLHDWTSHAADSFRYLITATSGGQPDLFRKLAPIDYSQIDGGKRGRIRY